MTRAPRIDFVISNPGHHVAQILPIFARLREEGVESRVISLCELRGFPTPTETIGAAGASCLRLLPPGVRRSPTRGAPGGGESRRWARRLAWSLLLAIPIARALRSRPDLAVLPNDAAFPYDRLVGALGARSVPFVLIQEGIRFPLPAASTGPAYGSGGALAVAAWGETSARYFRSVGVADERIRPTGNPRFDDLAKPPARSAPVAGEPRRLLMLTNPIDDQGFCTTAEKLALFRRFIEGLEPLLAAGRLKVQVRPHGRESATAYAREVADLPHAAAVGIEAKGSLYDLLGEADAVVVTASTAGLEALLFDRPLGVLEIPGAGFVYDYVERGAALGLSWRQPMAEQVGQLIEGGSVAATRIERYLADSLATRTDSGDRVTRLLLSCLRGADVRCR